MIRSYVKLLMAIGVLGLILAGCTSKQEGPAKKKIAGMVFQEDQFFRLVLFGMRDAARRNNVDLLEANSDSKPDKEIQLVNTYIGSKVDAIVTSPLSVYASVSALTRARDKGIAIITYNTTIASDVPASYVESDQVDLGASTGKVAREYIQSKLGGKAAIAILAIKTQTPEQSAMRTGGFKSQISDLPGVRIVSEQDAWLAEQAVVEVGDILTANPDVQIIWAANEGGTIGAVMAVKNAGKAGKVVVFGTDSGEQIANFLLSDDNILQAVTAQQPFEIGSLAVEAAVKVLKHEPVEKRLSLPGQLLTRENPAEVGSFLNRLKELSK